MHKKFLYYIHNPCLITSLQSIIHNDIVITYVTIFFKSKTEVVHLNRPFVVSLNCAQVHPLIILVKCLELA